MVEYLWCLIEIGVLQGVWVDVALVKSAHYAIFVPIWKPFGSSYLPSISSPVTSDNADSASYQLLLQVLREPNFIQRVRRVVSSSSIATALQSF